MAKYLEGFYNRNRIYSTYKKGKNLTFTLLRTTDVKGTLHVLCIDYGTGQYFNTTCASYRLRYRSVFKQIQLLDPHPVLHINFPSGGVLLPFVHCNGEPAPAQDMH